MRVRFVLVLIAAAAMVSVGGAATPDTLPDVSWLRFERAILDGAWVANWAFTYPVDVDLRSEGSFVLSSATEYICEGIDQGADCDCRCEWQHDDGWCGCRFPLPSRFRHFSPEGAVCVVHVHWLRNDGFRTWLKMVSVPCPIQNPVYLPDIQNGGNNG